MKHWDWRRDARESNGVNNMVTDRQTIEMQQNANKKLRAQVAWLHDNTAPIHSNFVGSHKRLEELAESFKRGEV